MLIVCHGIYVASHRRTLWFVGGYGIGLGSAWGIIMSAALLVFNDVERDFLRLEMRPANIKNDGQHQNGVVTKSLASGIPSDTDLTQRKIPSVYTATDTKQISGPKSNGPATQPHKLVWQGFPYDSAWLHVIDWAADLTTGFRGLPLVGPTQDYNDYGSLFSRIETTGITNSMALACKAQPYNSNSNSPRSTLYVNDGSHHSSNFHFQPESIIFHLGPPFSRGYLESHPVTTARALDVSILLVPTDNIGAVLWVGRSLGKVLASNVSIRNFRTIEVLDPEIRPGPFGDSCPNHSTSNRI
ncbi:uncharacterized protein Z518_07990 [Rhinocladiella mackenziei CBS 650.93]|uniref:Uncharacterized protein n=1 Tax=Rhinocladiella mackenziei CBS 650.93 TaxID=1442369 RepID=A0A0D2IFL9_9EURO|nr:uncharacterized protein Z518_07990 [Rhinocladiella mackenziei CBS 650.93]KIX02051.1 hypothetical protein Z518_07990 [Rhinocladiella mackenziei CBS 650.93]